MDISPENLKQKREANKIDRVLLAYRIGVHDTTLRRWEEGLGNKPVPKRTLRAWGAILDDMIEPS